VPVYTTFTICFYYRRPGFNSRANDLLHKLHLSCCFSVTSHKFQSRSSTSPTTATLQTLRDSVMIILFDAYKPISRPHVDATFLGTEFRRVGKNAKSDCQLRHVCLSVDRPSVCSSVSPYGTTRFPLDGFS